MNLSIILLSKQEYFSKIVVQIKIIRINRYLRCDASTRGWGLVVGSQGGGSHRPRQITISFNNDFYKGYFLSGKHKLANIQVNLSMLSFLLVIPTFLQSRRQPKPAQAQFTDVRRVTGWRGAVGVSQWTSGEMIVCGHESGGSVTESPVVPVGPTLGKQGSSSQDQGRAHLHLRSYITMSQSDHM